MLAESDRKLKTAPLVVGVQPGGRNVVPSEPSAGASEVTHSSFGVTARVPSVTVALPLPSVRKLEVRVFCLSTEFSVAMTDVRLRLRRSSSGCSARSVFWSASGRSSAVTR